MHSITIKDIPYKLLELTEKTELGSYYRISLEDVFFTLKKVTVGTDPNRQRQVEAEIALLQSFSEEFRIIDLYSFEQIDDSVYIVTEPSTGDLRALMREPSALEYFEVQHYSWQLLECIRVLHTRGVVHGDLKPANFIFSRNFLKLGDVGAASKLGHRSPNSSPRYEKVCSERDLRYTAPEALKGCVTAAADMWSCGCMIYEMVYGRTPLEGFESGTQQMLEDQALTIMFPKAGKDFDVPSEFRALMRGCMTSSLGQRTTVEEALNSSALCDNFVGVDEIRATLREFINFGVDNKHVEPHLLGQLVAKKLGEMYLT